MKLTWDENRQCYRDLQDPTIPQFDYIAGAFGWLDVAGESIDRFHWFVAAGLRADKTITFLEEAYGPLAALANLVVDIKDRLMISRVWLDHTEIQLFQYLRSEVDGLTQYQTLGKDPFGRPRYVHKSTDWHNFRGWEHVCSLTPVFEADIINWQAGYDLLVSRVTDGTTTYSQNMVKLPSLVQAPLREICNHPAIKAAIFVHNALFRKLNSDPEVVSSHTSKYSNRRRRF